MGNRRSIALAVLALLLAGGLWLFLAPGEGRGRATSPPATVPEASAEGSGPAVLAVPAAAEEAAVERAPLAGERVAEAGSADDAGATLLLELVIAETLAPAALAGVWYRDAAPGEELDLDELDGDASTDGSGGFRERARQARADGRGLVRLPLVEERSLQVLARQGEHLGVKAIPFERGAERRERLELVRDWDLRVQVLDASGGPAPKIGVFLRSESGPSSWAKSQDTDSGGIARFAHASLRGRERPGAAWSTGVSLPLTEPLEQGFDPARPLAEPIVFRLPPLAEVEVLVFELDGRAAADGTEVQLGVVRPGEPRDVSPFAHRRREYAHETTSDGRALFRHVEPGFEVEIAAGRPGGSARSREFFPGPVRPGERVQRTLRMGLDHPVLVFRVLDEASEPLRRTGLEVATWSRSGWNTSWDENDATTDGEGLLRVDLPSTGKEGDLQRLQVTAREGAIGASLDLAPPFQSGLNPMGDLVLRAPPVLASGHVVDAAGNGVPGAEVGLEASPMDQDEEWGWQDADLELKTGAQGEFTARGFVFGSRLRLTPRQEGRSGEPVECAAGASGVRLVLVATGGVAGAVLLDEDIPAGAVHVRLALEGEESEWWDWQNQGRIEESGEFRIDGQLPGRYALLVGLEDDLVLAEIPGVEVVAGEIARDPRLAAIDLRGKLSVVRLRFLPPRPDPELQGNLVFRVSDEDRQRWHHFRGERVELVAPQPRLDLTCTIRGYRTVRLEGVEGEREVPLEPALKVRLALPADLRLPEPPYYLKATLTSEGGEGEGNEIDWGASAFDETRESVSLVGGTGRMRVRWMLELRSGNSASASTIDLDPVQWVEVVESEQEQRFVLEVSQAALDKVIAEPPF